MNALTGASGVGSETWKRTCARDHAVALELGEDGVGRDRRVGEAEVAEHDVLGALAVAQPQLGQRAVGVRAGRPDLELRQRAEHRVLPQDPVGPRARLAVGQPAQAVAERLRGAAKDLLDPAQRHAADEMGAHRRGRRQRVGRGIRLGLRCRRRDRRLLGHRRSSPLGRGPLPPATSLRAGTGPATIRPAPGRNNAPEGVNPLLHGAVVRAIARAVLIETRRCPARRRRPRDLRLHHRLGGDALRPLSRRDGRGHGDRGARRRRSPTPAPAPAASRRSSSRTRCPG